MHLNTFHSIKSVFFYAGSLPFAFLKLVHSISACFTVIMWSVFSPSLSSLHVNLCVTLTTLFLLDHIYRHLQIATVLSRYWLLYHQNQQCAYCLVMHYLIFTSAWSLLSWTVLTTVPAPTYIDKYCYCWHHPFINTHSVHCRSYQVSW